MEIISHRGFWNSENQKNSSFAFEQSFKEGFGTETDFRDFDGKLVISHDVASANSELATSFFENYNASHCKGTLALNIKSDGLQNLILHEIKKHKLQQYFVFDMSVPDTLGYLKNEIIFFSRQSEYEMTPVFYEQATGIWLDSFETNWFDANLILNHIQNGKKVAIVSSELHKRNHDDLWFFLKNTELSKNKNLILCTDVPHMAKHFFNT